MPPSIMLGRIILQRCGASRMRRFARFWRQGEARARYDPGDPPPMNNATEGLSGIAACLGAALVWSSGGLFIKQIDLPPLEIALGRGLAAGGFFLVLWMSPRRRCSLAPGAARVASLSVALTMVLFVLATKWTTAAAAIFLQSTAPAWVLILGWLARDVRPTGADVAAVIGCGSGLALFFVGGFEGTGLWGSLAALASGVAFAVHMISMREVAAEQQVPVFACGNLLTAAIAAALAATGLVDSVVGQSGAFTVPSVPDVVRLLFLGVGQIGLGYVLFAFGIRRLPPLQVSLLVLLEPILNPVWVLFGTGEAPGIWALIGGSIVLVTLASHSVARHLGR